MHTALRSLRVRTPLLARPALSSRLGRATAGIASSSKRAAAPSAVDQFATGNNAYYAEEMFKLWKEVGRPSRGRR